MDKNEQWATKVTIFAFEDGRVKISFDHNGNKERSVAVIDLFSAAPDMLSALERIDPGPEWTIPDEAPDGGIFCEISIGDMRAIRKAIAKAKGLSET